MRGEAISLINLGELELSESNNDRARELVTQSLMLYRRVSDELGKADCLRVIGEIELSESNKDRAQELLDQALTLYERIRNRRSQALAHAWLARATTGDQRRMHCGHMTRLATDLNLPAET